MSILKFIAEWHGEPNAGIRAGSEAITIRFADTPLDSDTVEYFRQCIADYFDGASVYTVEEYAGMIAEMERHAPKD